MTYWRERLIAFSFMAFLEWVLDIAMPFVPFDERYFVACGVAGTLYFRALMTLKKSPFIMSLKILVFIQICAQFCGMAIYLLGFKNVYYNSLITIIMTVTCLRFIINEKINGAYFKHCLERTFVCRDACMGRNGNSEGSQ